MLVYLSGPITGCSFEGCTDWRKELANRLHERGHTVLDPMRGKDFLAHTKKPMSPFGSPHHAVSTSHAIIGRDSNDCAACHVMIVNLVGAKTVSIGTVMEIAWGWMLRKYILVVMEKENPHRHAFVEQAASVIVPTMDEALRLLDIFSAGR
jgi:hypothetical protein